MEALYPPITIDRPALRIGIMLNDWTPAAWVADILRSIQASGFASVTSVLLNTEKRPVPAPASFPSRVWRILAERSERKTVLWRLYERFDAKRHPHLNTLFQPVDVAGLLRDAAVIEITPLRKGPVHRFKAHDVARVRAENLDVILRFGFNIVRGAILDSARHGVWSYHHGDNNRFRGGPAGFWEMYERDPVTGCVLQVLTEDLDGGKVIHRSYGATASFNRLLTNRSNMYRKCVPFVLRCLRRLYVDGAVTGETSAPPYARRIYRAPTNAQMLLFLLRAASRLSLARLRNLLRIEAEHWYLAYVPRRDTRIAAPDKLVGIHPPKGHFWADPNLVQRDGRHFVFFEDFDYAAKLGHIAVMEIGRQGLIGVPRPAIRESHHLSYPFVFRWQDADYMLVESAGDRCLKLYRAVDFPAGWQFDRFLFQDISAYDATVFEYGSKWYLFANVSEAGGSSWDELFLFVADSPLGPWAPHPRNPIVSDVRCARPAGRIFWDGGKLFRPSQDCSRTYGSRISVQQVTLLSPTGYEETFAYAIEPPGERISGCHTLSATDELTIVDCKKWKWAP